MKKGLWVYIIGGVIIIGCIAEWFFNDLTSTVFLFLVIGMIITLVGIAMMFRYLYKNKD
ncbi:hypothetical protein K5X82_10175 [Halosquirtibacter xylanolyticus]|uniref:hypothetical protein n=1 Tax=Halosquirtibacter xylanolyticus TaxID=3374599 RepID=UPI003749143A|nr:hypothetical protein K5X82_10175 [Prolixibacteraceae bacterium]